MFSTKPYFIRAIYEWCGDNGLTPYLAVQIDERTRVPREFARDDQIVFNVSAEATHRLVMGNTEITFQARFNGAPFQIVIPVDAVVAIYARENGQGLTFEATPASAPEQTNGGVGDGEKTAAKTADVAEEETRTARRGTHLTLIK